MEEEKKKKARTLRVESRAVEESRVVGHDHRLRYEHLAKALDKERMLLSLVSNPPPH